MTTKTLNILIGDDEFKDCFTQTIFRQDYVARLQKQVSDYQFNWTYKTDSREVTCEAKTGKYNVVITDLDYTGGGKGKEGYGVIEEVCKINPKPLLILCSSCDRHEEVKEKTYGKIDFRAGGNGKGHKFDHLVEILTKHFNGELK